MPLSESNIQGKRLWCNTADTDRRWALDWTWIGLDPDYSECFVFGLDPDCESLQIFWIGTGFGLS